MAPPDRYTGNPFGAALRGWSPVVNPLATGPQTLTALQKRHKTAVKILAAAVVALQLTEHYLGDLEPNVDRDLIIQVAQDVQQMWADSGLDRGVG
jgi:hypothetical protein